MSDEQPIAPTTTPELTIEADDEQSVLISGATVSIPVEALRGGGGVTVTTTYTVTIVLTPPSAPAPADAPAGPPARLHMGGGRRNINEGQ